MYSEKELYEGCQKGSDSLRKALFEQYLDNMYAICMRYAGSEADTDDLIQEGFVKVFSHISSFRWNGNGSFEKWMKTVFINLAINHCKKTARMVSKHLNVIGEEIPAEADQEVVDSELNRALEHFSYEDILKSVLTLPDQFRLVFNLYAIEGLKHKEIAALLDIPIKTSTTRYLRAKAKLKSLLEAKLSEIEQVPVAQ